MRLHSVCARFYRSLNYDFIRASGENYSADPWDATTDGDYPFVRIKLRPGITIVVGANESGKSQVLCAIEAALTGEGYERSDFCRYSRFFSVDEELVEPEFGAVFTDVTSKDVQVIESLSAHENLHDVERVAFFRMNQTPVFRVYVRQAGTWSEGLHVKTPMYATRRTGPASHQPEVVGMWWNKAKCPVRAEEQLWIEESLDWLVGEFGTEALRRPVVVPEASFFPAAYTGSEDDVRAVYATVCARLEVPPSRVVLEFDSEEAEDLLEFIPMNHAGTEAAGHWQVRDGSTVVTIQLAQARKPVALVATIAHELGHERLLGESRIDPSRRDGEPLTDLFTVFFGMGIFTANAAFEFRRSHQGYRTSRLGYMTEAMYGYALARYAWLRGEASPDWSAHLDINPRTYLKMGLRFVRSE